MEEIGEEIILINSRVQVHQILGDKLVRVHLVGEILKRLLSLQVTIAGEQLQVLQVTMDLGAAQQ